MNETVVTDPSAIEMTTQEAEAAQQPPAQEPEPAWYVSTFEPATGGGDGSLALVTMECGGRGVGRADATRELITEPLRQQVRERLATSEARAAYRRAVDHFQDAARRLADAKMTARRLKAEKTWREEAREPGFGTELLRLDAEIAEAEKQASGARREGEIFEKDVEPARRAWLNELSAAAGELAGPLLKAAEGVEWELRQQVQAAFARHVGPVLDRYFAVRAATQFRGGQHVVRVQLDLGSLSAWHDPTDPPAAEEPPAAEDAPAAEAADEAQEAQPEAEARPPKGRKAKAAAETATA